MDNYIDSNMDSNNNIDPQFCQEGDLEDCKECEYFETCSFWNDDFEEDLDDYKYCWYEMSYYRFTERAIQFQHSELQ